MQSSQPSNTSGITVRFTPLNRILKPLLPTLYVVFLSFTLLMSRHTPNRWPAVLFVAGVLVTLLALHTWWYAWTYQVHADEEGITKKGGFIHQHARWDEVKHLDVRREGYFRSDVEDRTLLSITLAGEGQLLMHLGQDLRAIEPQERGQLLEYIKAHVDVDEEEVNDEEKS